MRLDAYMVRGTIGLGGHRLDGEANSPKTGVLVREAS